MGWAATADPERFDEAVEWFAARIPLTADMAAELAQYSRTRAFTISGVAQLDIVQQVYDSLLDAIGKGTPLDEWKDAIEEKLTNAWGKRDSARLETIYRNSTQQALNAGRWREQNRPDIKALRPYGLFDAIDDGRTSEICKHWSDVVLPLDEFARRNAVPQLHHRCRSQIRNISEREAKRRGITTDPPTIKADDGFGEPPTESEFEPDAAKYATELYGLYVKKREGMLAKTKPRTIKVTTDE